jgi:hypothetical protein
MLAAKITVPEGDNNEKLDENSRVLGFFIKKWRLQCLGGSNLLASSLTLNLLKTTIDSAYLTECSSNKVHQIRTVFFREG